MNVKEFVMRTNFSDELTANPEWLGLVQRAAEMLSDEVRDSAVVIPSLRADWTLQTGTNGAPVFVLRFSDVPDDSQGVQAQISLAGLRNEESLRDSLERLWRRLLDRRSRRQLELLGKFIKGEAGE